VETTIYAAPGGKPVPPFPVDDDIISKVRKGAVPFSRDGATPRVCIPLLHQITLVGLIIVESTDPERFQTEKVWQTLGHTGMLSYYVARARHVERVKRDNARLDEMLAAQNGVIGDSVAMRAVLRLVGKVAGGNSTILITGETASRTSP
jgi:transcriptional regulator with GAF, ATPase, and Fis domain